MGTRYHYRYKNDKNNYTTVTTQEKENYENIGRRLHLYSGGVYS